MIFLVKKNVSEAMKASMESYKQEAEKLSEEEIMRQIMKESKNAYMKEQDEIMKDIQEKSMADGMDQEPSIPPIQQVANMGFPMEMVLKAYSVVGDDVQKMIDYIYNTLLK